VDQVVRLDNIYYDLAKWNIRPDAAKELDKLVQTLNDNPTVRIELSSHTDCRGKDAYNMGLSESAPRARWNT
jgi:peptidoglycan-associated lipoprotein